MSMRASWRLLIAVAGVPVAALAAKPTFEVDPADAFPIELAFTTREFSHGAAPVASPPGDYVAYEVITPPVRRPQAGDILPNGTPLTALGSSVHLVATDVSKPMSDTAICSGEGNQWSPSWSADGKRLAFYSDADGFARVWTYDLDTKRCRRASDANIRGSLFSGSEPKWSPDGTTLYVPLDPARSPQVSASASSVAAADNGPIVLYGGNEGSGPVDEQESKTGSTDESMMRRYNAALAAITVDTGVIRTVVPAEDASRPHRVEVSASGKWLSFNSVPYPQQETGVAVAMDLLVVPARGGAPRLIAKALSSSEHLVNYTRLDYRWHPTQDRMFYLENGGLWSVEFDDHGAGTPRRLAPELGELAPVVLYFTADAKAVVVGLEPQGHGRDRAPQGLALVPLDGGPVLRQSLPELAKWQFVDLLRANDDSLWQPDPHAFAAVMRERSTGEQAIMRVDVSSGATDVLAKGMYRTPFFAAGGDHRHLVGIYEDIGTPPNLYRFTGKAVRAQQMTQIDSRLAARRYGTADVIEVRTPRYDGSLGTVRTTILLPPGAKRGDRLPGVVMIYSGSDLSTRASYFGGGMGNTVPNQVFTSRGYAVVMANVVLAPEGVASNPASQMTDEVLAQVYAAAHAGYIDIDRLAVSGQSYGGYSTGSIVSHTQLFRAGIPVNGPFDLASFYASMAEEGDSFWIRWAEQGQGRMGDTPWANPQRYIDNSPYYRVDRIRTPLLIVAGERDDAVPYTESKKLFVGLRRLNRPVQLAIYPGEGHVIAEWSIAHSVDVSQRMVDFLDKHLRRP